MAKQEQNQKEDKIEFEGTIVEALPKTEYIVEIDIPDLGTKHRVVGYLSGKMRKHYIKVGEGDKVKIEVSLYDPKRGRIVYKIDERYRTRMAQIQNSLEPKATDDSQE